MINRLTDVIYVMPDKVDASPVRLLLLRSNIRIFSSCFMLLGNGPDRLFDANDRRSRPSECQFDSFDMCHDPPVNCPMLAGMLPLK